MGLFNTLEFNQLCDNCGKSTALQVQFKYGRYSVPYWHLGDMIRWHEKSQVLQLVRDPLMKYIWTGGAGSDCCSAPPELGCLTVRRDVIEGLHRFSRVGGGQADAGLWPTTLAWARILSNEELMVLDRQFGMSAVYDQAFPMFASYPSDSMTSAMAARIAGRPQATSLPQHYSRMRYWEVPDEARQHIYRALLNKLYGQDDGATIVPNKLECDVLCPRCEKLTLVSGEFRYGPCGGVTYRLGQHMNWDSRGGIPCPRDIDRFYAAAAFSECSKCGHANFPGVVEILNDRIVSAYAWPQDIINSYALDDELYLLVKQFGDAAVRSVLSEKADAGELFKILLMRFPDKV